MNISVVLKKSLKRRLFQVVFLIFAVYLILRYAIIREPFLENVYLNYLRIPVYLANKIFAARGCGVYIDESLNIVFLKETFFSKISGSYIEFWPSYLMYRNWSLLVLASIWFLPVRVPKRLYFTLIFAVVHVLSVISGLYILGCYGPEKIVETTSYSLVPTIIGNFLFFTMLLVWILVCKHELKGLLQYYKIGIKLEDRRIHEALLLLFGFLILRNFLIPFIEFKHYVYTLLSITRRLALWFGQSGYIDGDQLIGGSGALALSKHCLGFITMYLFGSLVYITRKSGAAKQTGFYILFGVIILFIVNIVRLLLVFLVAQGENGYERANIHHEIYNAVIYVLVFLLWAIWFEYFLNIHKKKGNRQPFKGILRKKL